VTAPLAAAWMKWRLCMAGFDAAIVADYA
jgi:hypothetical protein